MEVTQEIIKDNEEGTKVSMTTLCVVTWLFINLLICSPTYYLFNYLWYLITIFIPI